MPPRCSRRVAAVCALFQPVGPHPEWDRMPPHDILFWQAYARVNAAVKPVVQWHANQVQSSSGRRVDLVRRVVRQAATEVHDGAVL